jgi:bifunctional non-homologous end joining protein LigD
VADDKLGPYRAKRDFSRTGEPAGGVVTASEAESGEAGPSGHFVVQRHRARRLHYDFRLDIDGVLVSWAVPKGPTLDPSVRRLAARTEDHPLEYAGFEGIIPSGEYGAGDVIVWDEGTYVLDKDPDPVEALDRGELHLDLHGQKLRGRFVLVRTGGRGADGADRGEQWLLLHKHDDHAVEGWDPEDHPRSVRSGHTNDEVAANPAAAWSSTSPPDRAEIPLRSLDPDDRQLLALDELEGGGTWEFRGRQLEVTNLDKVLFSGLGSSGPVTKREMIRHYATVSPLLVGLMADRPVNLHRYPNGIERPGFWHKAVPKHAPDWIERWEYLDSSTGEPKMYFVASEPATVAWLANYGAVELHPWTSTTASPRQPSYALFDLDPGDDTTWEELLVLARLHRTALDHLGVEGFPKVTGRRGIQIWVPVVEGYGFDRTREWVEAVSRAVGRTVPDLVSWEWGVRDRAGLARLDYTQNAVNKTLVAPYSIRPSAGAPVSVPIGWDELDDPALRPDRWTIRTLGERLAEVGDLWGGIRSRSQNLPELG